MATSIRAGAAVVLSALVTAACGVDAGVRVETATPIDVTTAPAAGTTETSPPSPSTTGPPAGTDGGDGRSGAATSPPDTSAEPAVDTPELFVTIPLDQVVDIGDHKPPRDHDDFVAVAITDIERWWGEQFEQVYGSTFEPIEGGFYAGYPERTSPIPGCGEPTTAYADLQLFVAFYCNLGDFLAYDDGDGEDSLLTPLADEFGPAVMGIVLAHEYGHAIQDRIGALDRPLATIITEQQADCFAGAWTGQAYRGESPLLRLGDDDLRAGLLAMLNVRDPVGINQFTPGGHGSAFDRVGAFQVGFLEGPARCAELLDDPLPLMPNQFQPFTYDELFGGNAPYACDQLDPAVVGEDFLASCRDAPDFLADDINNFWEVESGGTWVPVEVSATDDLSTVDCAGEVTLTPQVVVCPGDRTIVYDEPAVLDLYNEFGDFTLGYLYGIATAELEQIDRGSTLTGEPRALLDDCYTGAWVRDITPDENGRTPRGQLDENGDGVPDSTVTSSPGDLDEAIQMEILLGDSGVDVNRLGTPFEKIDAFRTGVLGGLDACDALFDG